MSYERKNAVDKTRSFLCDLLDPKKTPGIPKKVRDEARRCLKHFPGEYHMELAAEQLPDIFGNSTSSQYKP